MKWCGRLLIPLLTATTAAAFGPADGSSNLRASSTVTKTVLKAAKQRRELAEPTGTLNVLVLLMEFTDHTEKTLISQETIESLFMGSERDSSVIPSGSIQQYIQSNSYGNLDIEVTVVDWQPTDNTESYYANGQAGVSTTDGGAVQIEDSIVPLLSNLDTEGFDFSNFDLNKDKALDLVVVLHSGYAAQYGDQTACEPYAKKADRITDQQLTASEGTWTSADGKYMLGKFVIASAFNGVCNSQSAKVGAVASEMLHIFGLPDLYDLDLAFTLGGVGGVVGGVAGFDIMGTRRGFGNRYAWPGHMSGWSKSTIGWVNPIEITTDGVYTARPSEMYPDIYKISAGFQNPQEYLLIENRQPVLFDEQVSPESGGFVIYHIDETSNNVRGYPGQENWPTNGNHYNVAVLQRDGLYQLEKGENNGDEGDFYLPDMGYTLGPGNGNSVFPNTDSYSSGVYAETGIVITNFLTVDAANGVLSFEVQGLAVAAVPTDPPTMQPMTEAPTATTKKPVEEKEEPTDPPTMKQTEAPQTDDEEVDELSFNSTMTTMAPTTNNTNTTDSPTTDSATTDAPAPAFSPSPKPPTETPDFFNSDSSASSIHVVGVATTAVTIVGMVFGALML